MDKILIPIDFQKQSLLAVEQSFNLARLLEAEIVLLYVHEQTGMFSGMLSNDQSNETISIFDGSLQELARKASTESGLSITYRIEKGRVYSRIIDVAKEIDAKFIIMGTNSSPDDDQQEKMIGNNTSKIIRLAKCPVITINVQQLYHGCRNILLPLDLTRETRQKVTLGIEIAKIYKAGIKIISVLFSKNDLDIVNRLKQQANQVINFVNTEGVDCTFELIESPGEKAVVPTILKYAKQQGDIDLIMIMTQQESGIVNYFVSSYAQEIIRLSETPVLSVIPKELGFTSIFS